MSSKDPFQTQRAADTKRHLAGLPPEVFERIARFLPAEDLPQLRQTCRECASKVLRTYTQAHFTNRAFLLNEKGSLQVAAKIAAHEHFGRSMQKLTLHVDDIALQPRSTGAAALEPAWHADSAMRVARKSQHYQQQVSRHTFAHQRDAMRAEEQDFQLLLATFSHLRRGCSGGKKGLELEVRDCGPRSGEGVSGEEERRAAWGFNIVQIMTNGEWVLPDPLDTHFARVVFDALALSGCLVSKLTLGSPTWSVPLCALTMNSTLNTKNENVLRRVRHLEVHVWARRDSQCGDPEVEAFHFIDSLNGAELEELHIALQHSRGVKVADSSAVEVVFNEVSDPFVYWPMLKRVCLEGHRLNLEGLLSFVKVHDQLQKLDLVKCTFDCDIIEREEDESPSQTVQRLTGFGGLKVDEFTNDCWEVSMPANRAVERR